MSNHFSANPRRGQLSRLLSAGERGQIAILVALSAIIMFAIVGIAVDVGRLYATRVQLSRAVDAAALSGILELNGTPSGLSNAESKAERYFDDLEGGALVTRDAVANPSASELTMDATKSVDMYFLSVIGIDSANVSAHAKAGFGTQFLDVALVLDATQSMVGNPITSARGAAISFKDILLGNNPQGNVIVGVTPFRGCFRPQPISHGDCINTTNQVAGLSYNSASLSSIINNITAGGGNVGTNVCTGLAKGWQIMDGTVSGRPAHWDDNLYPYNRQFLILLSDGDNYYAGNNTYQLPQGTSSASSPTGADVGGNSFPCQPYPSCSSIWTVNPNGSPCHNGLHGTIDIAGDGFESNNLSGGLGWSANWSSSGDYSITTSSDPYSGNRHLRLRETGSLSRGFSLSGQTDATLRFAWKANSWESGDRVRVQISTNGSNWTTVETYDNGDDDNHYHQETVNLTSYAGQANVYVRFLGEMSSTSDEFFVDDVEIYAGTDAGSSDGYMNGNDGSNPGTCNEYPRPRERQLDVRTINLAQAIKAQGVEIYVVAFAGGVGGCNLGNTTIYDDENPADCNAINQSPAGPIGDATHDGTANHRLLKCIASNTEGKLDHYFYAEDDDELQGIFTAIANQIAHRLIE